MLRPRGLSLSQSLKSLRAPNRTSAMVALPKVLIVGGGMGGLALAQYLRSKGVDFEVFERDEHALARDQGWAVTLSDLIPDLERIVPATAKPINTISVSYGGTRPDESAMFDGYTGSYGGGGSGFLRANRARFREWLATGLPVHWNKRYDHHIVGQDGKVMVYFRDGTTATGDVLIGADGVNSIVRSELYKDDPVELNPLPVGVIAGEMRLSKEQSEKEREMGGSMRMVHAEGFRLWIGLKNVYPDGSCDFYWLLPWLDEEARKPDFWVYKASPEEQLKFVREKCGDLHPALVDILNYQEPGHMFKPLYIRDMVPKINSDGPVTLLGDAAHPMSPFRGAGAISALMDALELGELLSKPTDQPFKSMLRKYEQRMVSRATHTVLGSRYAVDSMALHRRPYSFMKRS